MQALNLLSFVHALIFYPQTMDTNSSKSEWTAHLNQQKRKPEPDGPSCTSGLLSSDGPTYQSDTLLSDIEKEDMHARVRSILPATPKHKIFVCANKLLNFCLNDDFRDKTHKK